MNGQSTAATSSAPPSVRRQEMAALLAMPPASTVSGRRAPAALGQFAGLRRSSPASQAFRGFDDGPLTEAPGATSQEPGQASSSRSSPDLAIWGPQGVASQIAERLKSVSQSAYPARDFSVLDYGARPCKVVALRNPYTDPVKSAASAGSDQTHAPDSPDCRPAFLAAIRACHEAGGGRVVVPSGNWYCAGPIVLLSNVNFHLGRDCHLYFSHLPADYAKDGPYDCGENGRLYLTRQANDCLNYGSPIYAYKQNNVALTGEGHSSILNAQAMRPFAGSGDASTCWWTFKGRVGRYGCLDSSHTPSEVWLNPRNRDLREKVPQISEELYARLCDPVTPWQQDCHYVACLSEAGVPAEQRVFGIGHYLRPCMVTFISCTNVLMENYQTNNSPLWQHHPVDCKNVVMRGVLLDSIGPNNDGFNPDACDGVLCKEVEFNTGDDCIAIKSGKNLDTQYGSSQNIVIQHCVMHSGHGGLTIGSEMGGGVQNVYVRNVRMRNKYWQNRSLNCAIRIKTNMNRGGFVRNVHVDDLTLDHGVSLTPRGFDNAVLPGSPINASVPLGVATATAGNPSAAQ